MTERIRHLDPKILSRVVERARALGPVCVVVFDLDSTLLDNRPRQARILREFGALHGLGALTAARPEHWDGWEIRHAMRNAGMDPLAVEQWAEPAKEFWRDRFFTSEYCLIDESIPGAVPFVDELQRTGARLIYCTGRHEAMREGTVHCFRRLGFPAPHPPDVQLLMKPTIELSDDDWKETAYAVIRRLGTVTAVFDNEPTHVNGYRRAFPDALCVHLATDDSGRDVPLADGIVSVHHFLNRA